MTTSSDLALRILISAKDSSGGELRRAQEGLSSLQTAAEKAKGALLQLASGFTLRSVFGEFIQAAETFKVTQARLKLVSDSTQEYAKAQKELFDIAQRSRTPLEGVATLYGRLETVIKGLGGTQDEALQTTETLSKALALTSQGVQQDSAALLQFSQLLANTSSAAQEWNSILEQSPGIALAIADGLHVTVGELKNLTSSGAIGARDIIGALQKVKDQVDGQFAQFPVTINQALVQVHNAWLKFTGEADTAWGATRKLASAIQFLANNFKPLADVATSLALLWAGRFLTGLLESAAAFLKNERAARQKAAADREAYAAAVLSARATVAQAEAEVKATQALIAAVRGRQASVAAVRAESAMLTRLAAQQKALDESRSRLNDLTEAGKKTVTVFERLKTLLSRVFTFRIALDIFDGLLEKFGQTSERVRLFQVAFHATLEKAMAIAGHFFSGDFLFGSQTLDQKLAEIDTRFATLAEGVTDAALKTKDAAQQIEEAQAAARESFEKTKSAVSALTASIADSYTQQNAAIAQALAERLQLIDAGNASERGKEGERIQAHLDAARAEIDLAKETADAKLALIENTYRQQNAAQGQADVQARQMEQESLEARKAIYSELAGHYAGVVDQLTQQHGREVQAAQQANIAIQDLARQHEFGLLDIARLGLSQRQKIAEEETEFTKLMREIRAEQAKGDAADQDKLNDLLSRAKALHGDITSAATSSAKTQTALDSARYDAKKRYNDLYEVEKTLLEANARAHESNAAKIESALGTAKTALEEVNGKLAQVTDKLNQTYLLKLGIDQASLSAVQQTIAELTAPATKIITIQTVQGGQAAPAPVEQRTGGPAGQPARMNRGGWPRKEGKLPGFGGGDKIRALLEQGEFVIRKEAVAKYGQGFFEALNKMTLGGVIRRATGGPAGEDDELRRKAAMQQAMLKLAREMGSRGRAYFAQHTQGVLPKFLAPIFDGPILFTSASELMPQELVDVGDLQAFLVRYNQGNFDTGSQGMIQDRFGHVDAKSRFYKPDTSNDLISLATLGFGNRPSNDLIPLGALSLLGNRQPKAPAPGAALSAAAQTAVAEVQRKVSSAVQPPSGQAAASKLADSARAVSITLKSPDGKAATGQFDEANAAAFLDVLKRSGLTAVGA